VRKQAVPLWLELAPIVRRTMLVYQGTVSTRNDQGQLASMHNKFVRLALFRLRLSMKEFLGELPAETEQLFGQVMAPDTSSKARIFLPTRPTVLARGEKVRVLIVAPGGKRVAGVVFRTRLRGAPAWTETPAKLLGRRTWEAVLGPFNESAEFVEYSAAAKAPAIETGTCGATLV
jgi:hypothetical protein